MGSGSSYAGGDKQSFIDVLFCQQDTTDEGERQATAERDETRNSALGDMREHLDTFISRCGESSEVPKYEVWIAVSK